jgi:hypothetical protein
MVADPNPNPNPCHTTLKVKTAQIVAEQGGDVNEMRRRLRQGNTEGGAIEGGGGEEEEEEEEEEDIVAVDDAPVDRKDEL